MVKKKAKTAEKPEIEFDASVPIQALDERITTLEARFNALLVAIDKSKKVRGI